MIPQIVDMASVRRVLIIKLSAMGDIIHALPVSAALKEVYPHLELTWAVEERFASLVEGNPCLTGVLKLPKVQGRHLRSGRFYRDYFGRFRILRREGIDLALDLQGLTKSAVVAVASGADTRLGYHWLREMASLVERPVPRRPESIHIVEQYLDVARSLGANPHTVRFPFSIPAEALAAVEALLHAQGIDPEKPFVSINPASARAEKEWGAAQYATLIDRLHQELELPTVLVTADVAVASQVGAATTRPFANLAGRTDLKQLAAVLRLSAAHVCGDTGSGHLAAALERPVVALIGPTDPERACPYSQRSHALNHREVCGVNCNGRRCQFARPHCMEAIRVDEVLEKVRAVTLTRCTGV